MRGRFQSFASSGKLMGYEVASFTGLETLGAYQNDEFGYTVSHRYSGHS